MHRLPEGETVPELRNAQGRSATLRNRAVAYLTGMAAAPDAAGAGLAGAGICVMPTPLAAPGTAAAPVAGTSDAPAAGRSSTLPPLEAGRRSFDE